MSFWSKLFGGRKSEPEAPAAEAVHEGYLIQAIPMAEGGQFRLRGTISKDEQTHTLIRADMFMSKEDCAEATIAKAKQVIAEQGDDLFR